MDGRYTHSKVQLSVRLLLPHTVRPRINTNLLFKSLEERTRYFIVRLIECKKGNYPQNVLL